MKYAFFTFAILILMYSGLFGQELVRESEKNDSIYLTQLDSYIHKLDSIAKATNKTSKNTEPTRLSKTDWDEYTNIILSFIAAIGTFLTVLVIYLDTNQNKIKRKFQEQLLRDLIRHFYRNMVVLEAIKMRLEGNYKSLYPSEEHLLKFKVLPEDLRINRFSSSPNHYGLLHKLELQLRNFNIEVDVAMDHLKNKNLSEEIKTRDLDTLKFKFGHLTNFVVDLLQELNFKFSSHADVIKFLKEDSKKNRESKKSRVREENVNQLLVPERTGHYFDEILAITDDLNQDILLEYYVINTIPF
jgi:hypothetical protein